jgi:hypothetical protein
MPIATADYAAYKALFASIAPNVRRGNATKKFASFSGLGLTHKGLAERECARLQDFLDNGLDPAYKNIDEFWYDFWPDFSWSEWNRVEAAALLLNEDWLALAAQVKAKHGFDFEAEVRLGRDTPAD